LAGEEEGIEPLKIEPLFKPQNVIDKLLGSPANTVKLVLIHCDSSLAFAPLLPTTLVRTE
jgi:hypothetical protein